jgi:hypothetical protein
VMMGPMVFVWRWKANSSKELCGCLISGDIQVPQWDACSSLMQERTVRWLSGRVSAALVVDHI